MNSGTAEQEQNGVTTPKSAARVKSLFDFAFHGEPPPAAAKLPNLRHLGVGP